jgi:hypothetical protein
MPKRSNKFQKLIHLIQNLLSEGVNVNESAMLKESFSLLLLKKMGNLDLVLFLPLIEKFEKLRRLRTLSTGSTTSFLVFFSHLYQYSLSVTSPFKPAAKVQSNRGKFAGMRI